MNMNMDFIKGFSVCIAILILYVFLQPLLQPQIGRYIPLDELGEYFFDTTDGEKCSIRQLDDGEWAITKLSYTPGKGWVKSSDFTR